MSASGESSPKPCQSPFRPEFAQRGRVHIETGIVVICLDSLPMVSREGAVCPKKRRSVMQGTGEMEVHGIMVVSHQWQDAEERDGT